MCILVDLRICVVMKLYKYGVVGGYGVVGLCSCINVEAWSCRVVDLLCCIHVGLWFC